MSMFFVLHFMRNKIHNNAQFRITHMSYVICEICSYLMKSECLNDIHVHIQLSRKTAADCRCCVVPSIRFVRKLVALNQTLSAGKRVSKINEPLCTWSGPDARNVIVFQMGLNSFKGLS